MLSNYDANLLINCFNSIELNDFCERKTIYKWILRIKNGFI